MHRAKLADGTAKEKKGRLTECLVHSSKVVFLRQIVLVEVLEELSEHDCKNVRHER